MLKLRLTQLVIALVAVSMTMPATAAERWAASWASAQMSVTPSVPIPADVTIRQTVRLSIGGKTLRVRISNLFGTAPLRIDAARIAKPATSGGDLVVLGSDRALAFGGKAQVVVPAGAEFMSDPIAYRVEARAHLLVSMHVAASPGVTTGHPGSRTTSFIAAGDQTAANKLTSATSMTGWFHLADVEVDSNRAVVAVIGDSITDGYGVITNSDARWTDTLINRFGAEPPVAIINLGIGGNRVRLDGLGPNLAARFDRDVITKANVRDVIVLEGINDIGTLTREQPAKPADHAALVAEVIATYRQLVARARGHGIRAIGGTILPFITNAYYHPDGANEADRQAINRWIRTPGNFDVVIDFDRVMRDPAQTDRLLPAYDSGDGLHPSAVGYRAMAEAVPLTLWQQQDVGARQSVVDVALTFDDLPAHGALPAGTTRLSVAQDILGALKSHGVTEAYGFVTGSFGGDDPDAKSVLSAWRAAGQPLANHSWTHANLDATDPDVYTADIIRNEQVIAPLMAGKDWRWFRYPFLSEGSDPERHKRVRGFLAKRGYRVASVTLNFDDYAYNEPYARCVAKGDATAIEALKTRWLGNATARLAASREQTNGAPLVALLHVGAFTAHMMPALLTAYKSAGVRFVGLAEAQKHKHYHTDTRDVANGQMIVVPNYTATPTPLLTQPDLETLCR